MGGGNFIIYEVFAARTECEKAIANLPQRYPKQFVAYFSYFEDIVIASSG
jgi:hypothetical protein